MVKLRIKGKLCVERAANGRLKLSIQNPGLLDHWLLRWKLQAGYGFRREGRRILGVGEGIVPDFVRERLRLEAGFDDFSGIYLLACDDEGDRFLTEFAQELAP